MVIDIILCVVIFLNLLLGYLSIIQDRRSLQNRFFSLLCLFSAIWTFTNFMTGIYATPLWLNSTYSFGSLVISTGLVWTFLLIDKFFNFRKIIITYTFALFFFIASFFNGFIVKSYEAIYPGGAFAGEPGVGLYLYTVFFLINGILILYKLFSGYRTSVKITDKNKLKYIIYGAFGILGVSFLTSFLFPLFSFYQFSGVDSVGVLIFLLCISYTVIKYNLLDIRVIATELLTFAIWIALLIRTLLSKNLQEWLFNGVLLAVMIFFGILLIRSVLKEVRQREKMEKMAGDLEVAYGSEKEARERVERAKAEDEALLGSIGDGVIAINKDGEVMFVNRVAEQMLGLDGQSGGSGLIGKPYEQVLEIQNETGKVLAKEKSPIYEVLSSGKKIITDAAGSPEKTIYFVRGDKTKFPAAITVAPVILQGRTIGAVNVFRDITVERQIDKAKSEFVSLASHQLRGPLTTIKWYSEILRDPKSGILSPKQKEYLNVIYDGNMRMIKLIDIMLDVSRLDAGKIQLNEELVDIEKVAKIIIKEEEFNIKKNKQKFTFKCEEKKPATLTDQNQLRIVLQNIISNAVRYTPAGGKIQCALKRDGDNFLFSVKDSGIGIPREQQKKIFGKLFRADNAFSHRPDGNGLGLYAAKATIENLGGKIWFESEGEGKGATFYATVPIKNTNKNTKTTTP